MSEASFFPDPSMLLATGTLQERWHERAALVAASRFGLQVFIRGVVEVSNFCRENCSYCGMRRDNRTLSRHRAQREQLAELIIQHRPPSITDINIQAGEDPIVVRELVLPLIQMLRKETALGLSVCLGTLAANLYSELRSAGASTYIMKFETADAARYAKLHAPGTFAERVEHIRCLARNGWNVSSGFIAGLPDHSEQELLANFALARALPLDGCSVSPFIPGDETPLASQPAADIELTLNCMAALRLMSPHWIIPAVSALNLAEPSGGYRRGLRTGANLVTINLTPSEIRDDYLLYKRDRFIMTEEGILTALAAEGLSASNQSLTDFLASRRVAARSIGPAEIETTLA